MNQICLPSKNSEFSLFHLGREEETLDDDNDDVIITVCHCLFLLHSLKPEVNDNKSETIVSFSKESGKKVIDPG